MEKLIVESIDKTNNPDKFALFIGRWQPFHEGHQWLIDQKLKQGKITKVVTKPELEEMESLYMLII